MAGNDVVDAVAEAFQLAPTLDHAGHVDQDREGLLILEIHVEMRCIAGDHHIAAPGLDPHRLHALGVAGAEMQADAGRDLLVAIIELHLFLIDLAHHLAHVLYMVGHAQRRVAHALAGRHMHLAFLQVQAGVLEVAEGAGVVVVQVGDDHVLDLGRVDAEQVQPLARQPVDLAAAHFGDLVVEAGVDDEGALVVGGDPDEIVQVLAGVVRVAADEILAHRPVDDGAVFDGVEVVGVVHGGVFPDGAFGEALIVTGGRAAAKAILRLGCFGDARALPIARLVPCLTRDPCQSL